MNLTKKKTPQMNISYIAPSFYTVLICYFLTNSYDNTKQLINQKSIRKPAARKVLKTFE
jgi:hypothetical protein